MRLFVLLLLALPFIGNTQDYQDIYKEKPIDSVRYYQDQLRNIQRRTMDSLRQSEGYQTAIQGLARNQAKTDNYTSFTIFTETLQADYTGFNRQLYNTGFSPLSGHLQRIGLGFTSKSNRAVVDVFIMTFSLSKKSKRDDESLTSNLNNLFQFNLGYDLVKAQRLNVYPYAGLSIRDATLTYKKPAPEPTNPTTFLDLMKGDESTSASSMKAGYEAGIGLDIQLGRVLPKRGGTMLFAKAGTSGPIGKEKYKGNESSFDPGIKYGKVAVALGFKFFGRH